jgi:hypothetical protein
VVESSVSGALGSAAPVKQPVRRSPSGGRVSRIRTGRRRAQPDWWLDRGEEDDPIHFEIVVALGPNDLSNEARPEQERLVERMAERLRNEGLEGVRDSADRLEQG